MIELNEVLIELSNNCNLSCKMCGYGQKAIEEKRFISWDLFCKIINSLKGKTEIIRLNGRGESTLHPEFNKMLAYTRDTLPNVGIHLFTNLSFKSPLTIESFKKYNTQLFISIDSPDKIELEEIRINCDYDLIKNIIDNLSEMNTRPFLVFTMMEDNLHRIYDIAHFAIINDLNIIYNTVRYDEDMTGFMELVSQNIEEINHQFKKAKTLYADSKLKCIYPNQIAGINIGLETSTKTYGHASLCPSLNSQICILHDGLVSPCNMFNPYIYGNLNVETLEEIWSSGKRDFFIKNYKKHYYCKNCACMG